MNSHRGYGTDSLLLLGPSLGEGCKREAEALTKAVGPTQACGPTALPITTDFRRTPRHGRLDFAVNNLESPPSARVRRYDVSTACSGSLRTEGCHNRRLRAAMLLRLVLCDMSFICCAKFWGSYGRPLSLCAAD